MTASRELTRSDILPLERYVAERPRIQRHIAELKRPRRVELGPFCAFYFENRETLWYQVQEMLRVEKGGEGQIADELAAYNPLVPRGSELSATVMFEIGDPARRDAVLHLLGGVEHHMWLRLGDERVRGIPDPSRENTSPEGKASAVQFVKFPLTAAQKAAFRSPATTVALAIDHPDYAHQAPLPEATRRALLEDLD